MADVRIGKYISPITGEEDWFEPHTVGMIVLQPRMVTRVGDTNPTAVDFKLSASPDGQQIRLSAEYSHNEKKYSSMPTEMSSIEFADMFKDIVYSEKALDESDMIKQAKEETCQKLTQNLMNNGILMGGMQFAGFGFVFADGDKIMTIDSIDFDYSVQNEKKIYKAVLKECVSQASLSNIENPEIKFWTGTHLVELASPKVEEANEGKTKQYTVGITDIIIKLDTTIPEHQVYEKKSFNNEDFMEAFLKERKSLLADLSDNDGELDDRFDFL